MSEAEQAAEGSRAAPIIIGIAVVLGLIGLVADPFGWRTVPEEEAVSSASVPEEEDAGDTSSENIVASVQPEPAGERDEPGARGSEPEDSGTIEAGGIAPEAGSEAEAELPDARAGGEIDVKVSNGADPSVVAETPRVSEPQGAPNEVPPSLPEFDLVRVDAEGAGVVAGRADPGTRVRVLANGSEIATAEADAKGEFVAFIQTPASDEGQLLSLVAEGQTGLSEGAETVLLVPVALSDEEVASAPAILKKEAGSDTVTVVQPGALGKVRSVTLDAITYDEAGAVVLSGRAPKIQSIRIYVDAEPVIVVQSSEAGTWDATLSGVAAGRYVLRVDALSESGSVESRVESPFQRVFPAAAIASLSQITVQPGNTLWVMAEQRYGNGFQYTQIFAANEGLIRDPDLIYPGQILELPDAAGE